MKRGAGSGARDGAGGGAGWAPVSAAALARFFAAFVVALAALAVRTPDAWAGDPHRRWLTLETEHFVVTYPAPLDDIARRVGVVAERAHATLSPALGHAPSGKTRITVIDDTDGANGFANVVPRNAITVYATAPSGVSALGDHDDWLYSLVAHEYAHVLHLDTMEGLPDFYNFIFGKSWAPNQTLPRWMIEGLATYEESKRSAGGRTRNTEFDAYLRVPVLEGSSLRLDQITSVTRIFPRGNIAYLHGSSFLRYLFDRFGDDKLAEISQLSGAYPIPYAMSRPFLLALGAGLPSLYDDWMAYLGDRYSLQAMAIERRAPSEAAGAGATAGAGRRLTFTGETNQNPRYSADGKELLWFASDGLRVAQLRAMPVGGDARQARDVVHLDALSSFDVLADGSLVFEQSRSYRDLYQFQDLFRWDRQSGAVTQLTRERRARDPAVSPDERRVAYSQNLTSTSVLAVMALAPGAEGEVVWRGGRFDQAFQPAWSPDGRTLAFSVWQQGGFRDVVLLELATRELTYVTRDRAMDGAPVFSPDGAWLFFESDRTGVNNVYAYALGGDAIGEEADREGRLWQVTDEIGGASSPAVSPDGRRLAYRKNVAEGYDLEERRIAPASWRRAMPYLDDRPPPVTISDEEARVTAPRPYRAIETLAPLTWTYEVLTATSGSHTLFRTDGGDTAGLHSYALSAGLRLPRGEVNVAGSYFYGGLRTPLRVSAARTIADRNGYRIDGRNRPYRDEILSATSSISVPGQRKPGSAWFLSFDYSLDWTRLVEKPDDSPDPNDILPRKPVTDFVQSGLGVRLSYSSLDGTLHGVGPQTGTDLSLSTRMDLPELGAEYRALTVGYSARWFGQLPWGFGGAGDGVGYRPSVAMRLGGSLRTGDLVRTASFGLGGFPEQDLVQAVIDRTRAASTGILRGYPARTVTGNQVHLLNGELRQLVWNVERGVSALPFYVQRLHVAALWDAGAAWDNEPTARSFRTAIGGALRLDVIFGYFVTGTFELGAARGLTDEGVTDGWILLTGTL
jgi:WD40-like Beta Propeller Repeat